MREIKFRAFDKESGEMHLDANACLVYGESVNEAFDNSHYEWMQFTGLKDKNGKEIYEGDYLSDGLFKVLVEWGASGWVCGDQELWAFTDEDRYEVVGNIYENSELLENIMNPTKNNNPPGVCDCIYNDGACEEHHKLANDQRLKTDISIHIIQHIASILNISAVEYGHVYDSEKHEELLNRILREVLSNRGTEIEKAKVEGISLCQLSVTRMLNPSGDTKRDLVLVNVLKELSKLQEEQK